MRKFHAAAYVLARGLRGMSQAPLVQAVATLTTAVCMLLMGICVLLWLNARGAVAEWGLQVPLTVYLADDATDDQASALQSKIAEIAVVEWVELIAPSEALDNVARGLGEDRALLEGVDASVFPIALDVYLDDDAPEGFGLVLAERLARSPAVHEVAVAGAWADRVSAVVDTLGWLASCVSALVGLAAMTIVWCTIRLGVFARRSEVEILRLIGGTVRFVRGPFVVEGVVQGALGAAAALVLLRLGFDLARPFLERGFELVLSAGTLRFFTPLEVGLGVAFGAVLGWFGSRMAVGRHVEV